MKFLGLLLTVVAPLAASFVQFRDSAYRDIAIQISEHLPSTNCHKFLADLEVRITTFYFYFEFIFSLCLSNLKILCMKFYANDSLLYCTMLLCIYFLYNLFFKSFSFICCVEMKKSCNKFMQQFSYVKKPYNKPWELCNGQVDWGLMVAFTIYLEMS